jgi:transcriptional regulator with XRE-family HTH domain
MTAVMMRVRKIQDVEVAGLGEKIKAARKSLSGVKSLDALCEECGFSRTYWYDLEKEQIKGTLSAENLKKLESALAVDFGVEFE